jgi:hypothetical protein
MNIDTGDATALESKVKTEPKVKVKTEQMPTHNDQADVASCGTSLLFSEIFILTLYRPDICYE